MKNFLEILSNVELFKNIEKKDIEEVFTIDLYCIKKYSKEAIIYFQNEVCTSLDVVLSGEVSVYGMDKGGAYISVTDFERGDIVGGNLIFCSKNTYPMTIIAKGDAIILHIKKELILRLCQKNTEFLSGFLQSISDNTVVLADKIKTLALKSLRETIIDFLIYEQYMQKSNKIKLRFSKKVLAEKFGVERTSLSRELSKMRNEGLIEFDAYTITIIDL